MPYDALYVSPHFDDAVLSCGGQLAARARRGERVLIYTLAAGEPALPLSQLAATLHAQWAIPPDTAARRAEDQAACALLRVAARYGTTQEALYRHHPRTGDPLYPILRALYKRPHPGDEALIHGIDALRALPPAREYVVPLGIGGHVDHQLTRLAAERAFGPVVRYYEDYPYCARFAATAPFRLRPWRWRMEVIPLGSEDLAIRCQATAAYASQVAMIYGDTVRMEAHIRRYVNRVGGERLWRKVAS